MSTSVASIRPLKPRIIAIDFWRGLALVAIMVTHLPYHPSQRFTVTAAHGFSDTSAWFFFLSGFVVSLVYGRLLEERGFLAMVKRLYLRVAQLVVSHAFMSAVFVGVFCFVAMQDQRYPAWWFDRSVLHGFSGVGEAFLGFFLLDVFFFCGDILPGYIGIMLMLPLFLGLERYLRIPFWIPSVVVYVVNLVYPLMDITHTSFNPFAWQFLFCLGYLCCRLRHNLVSDGRGGRLVLAAATTAVLAAFIYRHPSWFLPQAWTDWVLSMPLAAGKKACGPLFLCHALLLMFVLGRLLPVERLREWFVVRWIARLGAHSLTVFVTGTLVCQTAYVLHGDGMRQATAMAWIVLGLLVCYGVTWLGTGRGKRRLERVASSEERVGEPPRLRPPMCLFAGPLAQDTKREEVSSAERGARLRQKKHRPIRPCACGHDLTNLC